MTEFEVLLFKRAVDALESLAISQETLVKFAIKSQDMFSSFANKHVELTSSAVNNSLVYTKSPKEET